MALLGALSTACSQDLDTIKPGPTSSGGGGGGRGGGGGGGASPGSASVSSSGGAEGTAASGGAAAARKRGIAYGYHSDADLAALSAGIGWFYNWAPKPDDTLSKGYASLGVDYVPMIWGGTFNVDDLSAKVPADAKYLLTFNEPNFGAQANLTPEQAAALWPKIEQFAKSRNLEIVSPAPNYCGGNCNETSPFDWLDKFFAACKGCKVDHVAFHWYACTKDALTWVLGEYHAYNKPLWLTEFSCLDDASITEAKELQYMEDAIAVLEADPMVLRYAWFTGRFNQQPAVNLLAAASGKLTPLGQKYVGLPAKP